MWYSRSGLAFLLLSGTWWDAKGRGDGAHFLLMGKSGSLSPLQTGQRMWLEVNGVETTNPSPQNTYTLNPWLHRGTRTKIDPEQRVHIEPEPCCTVMDCCCLIPVVFDMGKVSGQVVDVISHLEDTWTNSEIRFLFLSKARDVSPLWQKSFESSCIKLPSKESVLKLGVGGGGNLLQHIEESSINRQSDYKWNTEKAIWLGGKTNLMTTYGKTSDTNNHTVTILPPTSVYASCRLSTRRYMGSKCSQGNHVIVGRPQQEQIWLLFTEGVGGGEQCW